MLQEMDELSPTRKKLRVHVPEDVIRAKLESAYSELRATAKIPGFRPGKVPQSILRKKYGKNVEAEILQKVVPEYYAKAIKEAKLEPVGYPQVEGGIELKADEPLSFTVTVDVKPEIQDLRYEAISVKKKDYTVEDEEVDKAMQSLQESKALFSVTEEAVGEGDLAVINGEAYIDGDLREELSYKEYPLLQGTDSLPSEFNEEILGRKKGDEFEVKLTFEADYPNRTVAGKEVLFKIKVLETKKKNLPPVDDDFAKEFGLGTVEELRNKIRDDIGRKKMSEINLAYKKEILNQLVRNHTFEIPESMLNDEIESFIAQMKESAARRNETMKSEDKLRRDYEANARENVKSVILLDAIGKKENIVVNDDDVRKAVEEIAARHNLKPEEVTKLYSVREGSLDAMTSRLFGDKELEFLLQKAVIE
jgi:trigger factor